MSTFYRAIVRGLSGAFGSRSGTPPRSTPVAGSSRQKQMAVLTPLLAATILASMTEPYSVGEAFDRSGDRRFAEDRPSSAGNPEEHAIRRRPPGRFQVY